MDDWLSWGFAAETKYFYLLDVLVYAVFWSETAEENSLAIIAKGQDELLGNAMCLCSDPKFIDQAFHHLLDWSMNDQITKFVIQSLLFALLDHNYFSSILHHLE